MRINLLDTGSARQGDLLFIIHSEKPYKTGWWRKVVDIKNGKQILVLERPLDKYGKRSDNSRMENDMYVMSTKISHNKDRYKIIAVAHGSLGSKITRSKDIIVKPCRDMDFIDEYLEMYNEHINNKQEVRLDNGQIIKQDGQEWTRIS